jgi:ABC-2 type transport system ATP-binding protein
VANKEVGKFSAGMIRRLLVSVALLKRPDLLILDEPWTALDPEGAMELSELLSQLKKREKITMLISTHDLFRAHRIADRIGIMVRGKIQKIFEASEVRDVEHLYLKTVGVSK